MTRLAWNAVGERFFEVGVDRGVLYLDNTDGVSWNGLISVSESPVGSEVTSYFIDGIKYLAHASSEDFEATIEAYTYPEEFALCDGTVPIKNGLSIAQQRKQSFGFSYRTKVGNDVEGAEHAYKIHLVYGALATPSERANNTIGDSIDPDNFSWTITTKAPDIVGYKPASHFVIDTREADGSLIQQIEDILYGTDVVAPRMPSVSELVFIFETWALSAFDAGSPDEDYFITFDGGSPPSVLQTSTIDGGAP